MKTITLQIEPDKARQLHKTASPELKIILEASAPCGFFSGKITDRINSYKDACVELGVAPMNESEMHRAGFRQDEIDCRKLETIATALNEGEIMDWNNSQQRKYFPWFDFAGSSGFAFYDTYYGYSGADAGDASRLCFKSDELARYAGKQFLDLYKSIIDNKPE